jgi:hypothetical protein
MGLLTAFRRITAMFTIHVSLVVNQPGRLKLLGVNLCRADVPQGATTEVKTGTGIRMHAAKYSNWGSSVTTSPGATAQLTCSHNPLGQVEQRNHHFIVHTRCQAP